MAIKPNQLSKKKLQQIWAQVPADYYDQGIQNNLLQKLWHTQKLNQILKLLPANPKKVLDVGCSSAVLTASIAETLPESRVVGLDSYKDAIDFARSKYPHIKFAVADAHRLPFKKNSFDLIICTETLEHLINPKQALMEIKRVLNNKGVAIISMDTGSLMFRIIWYFWTKTKGKVWENAHLHEFNSKILEELIKEAGFKIKKKIYSHLGMAITFLAQTKS